MKKIVIFASGTGSNAENIIKNFPNCELSIWTNNPHAKVIEKSHQLNVMSFVFTKKHLSEGIVMEKIININPDLIVLAGFLLQIPQSFAQFFEHKIINIHPALLPKYGGKGMYGNHVHQAVLQNKEQETGITIHYVNENYDEGDIIFQEKISIENCKSIEEITQKIHELEHLHFPKVIQKLLYSE
ncbi:MAG: phosphoribosylglycinamide formyltransferase [Flavobacterium sp.]